MIQIGFLGTGNMGTAILKGILGSALRDKTALSAFDPVTEKATALLNLGVHVCQNEADAAQRAKFLILSIKPQMFGEVLPKIAGVITEETVLVSIAAGIGIDYIKALTKPYAKVVLAMPNTPLLLGYGATALAPGEDVTEEEFSLVRQIFDACGITEVLKPEQMKEIIAIHSSSPAFIYLFAKGFLDYGEKVGLPKEAAKRLFAQALIGSAKMITDSGHCLDELIRMVSSPGGTTIAGLDELYEGKLTDTVRAACESCTKRAYELSK